jgi:hypothetical protein
MIISYLKLLLLLRNNHKNFNSIAPLTPTLAPKTGGTM